MNIELTNLMYELYDREFDIDETFVVIESLIDLRRINKIKNRKIRKYGKDSDAANFWLDRELESYKNCAEVFKRYKLKEQPYKII